MHHQDQSMELTSNERGVHLHTFEDRDAEALQELGRWSRTLMTHKYRGSIVVLSISKSVEPNEVQKEMISGYQQGILCKY